MNTNVNINQNQNNNEHKSTVVDSPVMTGENDLLNLSDYRNALIDYLNHAQTPISISLQGEWGSGKTSLMRSLEDALCIKENSPFLSVWINTWQFSLLSNPYDYSQAAISIMQSIVKQIADKDPEDKFDDFADNTVSLMVKGGRFVYDIAGSILLKKVGLEKEDIDNAIANFKYADTKKLQSDTKVQIDGRVSLVEQLKDRINDLVNKVLDCDSNKGVKKGFIFFIDDLDRIKPSLAVEILEILKNIFDFDHCIFIIAIDYSVVVDGLKSRFVGKSDKEYRVYFDKLLQVQITMPVNLFNITPLLKSSLNEISFFESNDDIFINKQVVKLSLIVKKSIGNNPRNLKRLINNLSLVDAFRRTKGSAVARAKNKEDFDEKIQQNSISSKIEIFILLCIQLAFPQIYLHISERPTFFSDDKNTKLSQDFFSTYELENKERAMRIKDAKWSNDNIRYASTNEPNKISNRNECKYKIYMWEIFMFEFCERDTKLKSRFPDVLFVLDEFYDIFNINNDKDSVDTFLRYNEMLQWISVIDMP